MRGGAAHRDHPALARLHRRVVNAPQRVVVLQGWPESGLVRLAAGLAERMEGTVVEAASEVAWQEVAARLEADDADNAGRCVVLVRRTAATWPRSLSRAVRLGPASVCLTRDEVAGWLANRSIERPEAVVRWLTWWSGGWLGALERWADEVDSASDVAVDSAHQDDESLRRDHDRAHAVETELVKMLTFELPCADATSGDVQQVLALVALAGPLPVAVWRRSLEVGGNADVAASWSPAFDRSCAVWFPDRSQQDTVAVAPVLAGALGLMPVSEEDAASRDRWLIALAHAVGERGDRAARSRLRRLGGLDDSETLAAPVPDPSKGRHHAPRSARIVLDLLGHPRARYEDGQGQQHEVAWRLRRAMHVVAFLALAPDRRASREELIEAIWPDVDLDAVRKNFHPVISDARRTLRRALNEIGTETEDGSPVRGIVHRQGIYQLDPVIDWRVDVDAFRQDSAAPGNAPDGQVVAVASDLLDRWMTAWKGYRGPLLDGLEDTWVVPIRDRLARDYRALLRRAGAALASVGRSTEALDAYRTALLEDPYNEPVHRAVMELYAAQGRRDLVLVQFLRLQDHLKELNVEPRAETQRWYDRLMREEAIPAKDS